MSQTQQTAIQQSNAIRPMWHPFGHPADTRANSPRVITNAEGIYITDSEGNRLLDAVGGLWNVNLGYSAEPIIEAITRQLRELPYYPAFHGRTNPPAEILSRKLVDEWFAQEEMT